MFYNKIKIDAEIKFISTTLCNNGFPLNVVQTVTDFNKIKQVSAQRCPVYLHLPWLGGISERLLSKSYKLYKGVIFQPMYRLFLKSNLFWHLSVKMFFLFNIIILLFIHLGVVVVQAK